MNIRQSGFTIIELVIVIVLLGILSTYAAIKSVPASTATLPSQAMKMAADLRHVQALASSWGVSLVVLASEGGHVYSVKCKTASATGPCNSLPVVDPVTGTSFSVDLQSSQPGVTFVAPTTATLTFDSLGRSDVSAIYTLSSGGSASTSTVSVAVTTGRVTTP